MIAIRFFTDEDVYGVIAVALRAAGYDARSAPESGRRGESDESQLEWAGNEGRVLVTFNVSHFANLHTTAASRDAETMCDRMEFLSDW